MSEPNVARPCASEPNRYTAATSSCVSKKANGYRVFHKALSALLSRHNTYGQAQNLPLPTPDSGSRFLVPGSQFSVPGSQFLVLGSWFLVLGSWFLVLGSQFLVLGSRFLVLGSRFLVLGSWFSVLGSWFSVLTPPPALPVPPVDAARSAECRRVDSRRVPLPS